jgi:hypothetical protein
MRSGELVGCLSFVSKALAASRKALTIHFVPVRLRSTLRTIRYCFNQAVDTDSAVVATVKTGTYSLIEGKPTACTESLPRGATSQILLKSAGVPPAPLNETDITKACGTQARVA